MGHFHPFRLPDLSLTSHESQYALILFWFLPITHTILISINMLNLDYFFIRFIYHILYVELEDEEQSRKGQK